MKFMIDVHWKNLDFVVYMLSVRVSCAAGNNLQSGILNGLQFLDDFDMIGLRMVFAYSKMWQTIALNVKTINSFCLPHLVKASAFFCFSDADVYML